MYLARGRYTVPVLIFVCFSLLATSCGQTFQYSRGWTNGKRSATVFREWPSVPLPRNGISRSDLVHQPANFVPTCRDLDVVPYPGCYDVEAMDYPNLNKGSMRATVPPPGAESLERTKWRF